MNKFQSIQLDGLPVSVNAMYRNVKGRGRVKSQRYNTWLNAVGWQVKSQSPEPVAGNVEVSLFCKKQNRRKRDIDNCIKAVLDMLVNLGLIEDDSKVIKVSAEWTQNPNISGTLVMFGPHTEFTPVLTDMGRRAG